MDRVSEERELLIERISEICRRYPLSLWLSTDERMHMRKHDRNIPEVHQGPRIVYVSKQFLTMGHQVESSEGYLTNVVRLTID